MSETTDVVRRVIDAAEGYLKAFGGSFTRVEDGVFYTKRGSTIVRIEVLPWGDSEAFVRVSSDVVSGARLEPELLRRLLRANHDATFGAFGVSEDGVVTLSHGLFGKTMDRDELVSAVYAVARVADEWDDRIVADFGGDTAVARLADAAKARDAGAAEGAGAGAGAGAAEG